MTFSLGAAVAFAQASGPAAGAQAGSTAGAQSADKADKADKKSDAHGQGAHSADHGMSTNKGAGLMVGKTDHDFMVKAAQGGMMELEATRLAQEKATSSEVKEFARKLEQDHQKANEQLKQLAAQKNVDLPEDMGKHAAMLEKIRNLSGDKFDKEFMKMQVNHHKKDVNEFQKHANRSMDSDVKAFASATLPTLQQHLQQAQELQGSTRGRSATTQTTSPSTDESTTRSTNPSTRQSDDESTTATPSPRSNTTDSTAKPQGSNNPTTRK
jgi:putative membrane protein